MKTHVNPYKFLVALGIAFVLTLTLCGTVFAQSYTFENEVKIKGKFKNATNVSIQIYEDGVLMVAFTCDKRFSFKLNPEHHYKVIFADKDDPENPKVLFVQPNDDIEGLYIFPINIDFESEFKIGELEWIEHSQHFAFKPIKTYDYE